MISKILIFIIMLVSIGFGRCKNNNCNNNVTETNVVQIQKIQSHAINKQLLVSGNIEGNKTVRLGFMVAGKVNHIAVEEGQSIKAGQLLASIDPENYSIAKDIADANLDQTQDEYNRLCKMHDSKSISESDFNKITNALKVAKAQQKLQANNLSDTRLYSPINGILIKKGAETGEIIGVGLPLFVISDIQKVKVNVSVPESDLRYIHIGNKANVYVSALDSTFTGAITEIGSVAEATTRTFSIKVELKNPNMLIRPGMTAEVKIKTGKTKQIITIPPSAILHDIDNSSYIFIADTIKNQAFKRKISLGNILDNNIEVVSGVTPGELVIVSGQQKLSNGSVINLK
jgi:RND family efflux transporter MFP subunit